MSAPHPSLHRFGLPGSGVLPGGWRHWFIAALVVGGVLTCLGWYRLHAHEMAFQHALHEAAADRLEHELTDRMGTVDFILRGVAGLFDAQRLVERREFEMYISGLRPIEALPELSGIGLIRRVEVARIPAIEALLAASYGRPVRIHPTPDPARSAYAYPVSYFWPLDASNAELIGFDGFSEPLRQRTMEVALSSNRIVMSPPVLLLLRGRNGRVPGVLIYRAARPVDDLAEQLTPEGLIVTGIDVRRMFDALREAVVPDHGLRVMDVTDAQPHAIYTAGWPEEEGVPPVVRRLRFGERVWEVSLSAQGVHGVPSSTLTALAGAAICLLLAFLVASLAGQQKRALAIAERMTGELRDSEKRFELAASATDEGIWEWQAGRRALFLSPRCDRLLGYPKGGLPRRVR